MDAMIFISGDPDDVVAAIEALRGFAADKQMTIKALGERLPKPDPTAKSPRPDPTTSEGWQGFFASLGFGGPDDDDSGQYPFGDNVSEFFDDIGRKLRRFFDEED